ncbi:neuropeptides capa receptor-like isoform X2 [Ceratina calcarata]|uniref:Neuropeptides capa receptor-like isoform X2 n=1 Tax=Ceratina calcarata TaxID=156304 RepID=A0AAJ7IYP1_9HYME|nr:neuropeptides capa receptor-like isoform X2 [Ceratina calcarata]
MNASGDYYENISDEADYLERVRGPKYLPLTLVLPVTLANTTMQTATNYYLFNLAISDLLLLVLGLPFELNIFWRQYPWQWGVGICKLRAYVSETSSYVSVLTIVAFSVERYLAIYHPLRHYGSGLKRSMRSIFGIWLIALIFAIPFAVYIDVDYVEYPENSKLFEESAICVMLRENMPDFPICQLSCTLFFLVPMAFIAVLYLRIGLKIQKDTLSMNVEGSVHGETKQAQSRKTITRMLSAVVITFFICWAPFHVQRLLYVYQVTMSDDVSQWVYALTGCLYYFSTTINPILYNVMSVKYRNAFKETCRCSPNNPSISRVGLTMSSMRESSTICGAGPSGGSQVFRVRSVNYHRTMKYSMTGSVENNSRVTAQLNSDDDERVKRRNTVASDSLTADKSVHFLQEPKKLAFLVQAKNGRLKCQMSDNSHALSNETHI